MPEFRINHPAPLLRILDANQNRAGEALRVIEEYLRFGLDDPHLTEVAKQLRHQLRAVLAVLPRDALLSCRDTAGDVGTRIAAASESQRGDLWAVVAAAFARLEQSLRALEEYGKIVDPQMAAGLESIRYRSYSLEKGVGATRRGVERLAECRLYVLLEAAEESVFTARLQELIAAGVDAIQLRDKRLDDRTLLARARQLRAATAGSSTLFIVNDRPDVALLCRADGVHVGQEELPVAEVRRLVGPDMLIGVSTHSIEQAREGVLAGADYLGVGPVFASLTKKFPQFAGLEFVREAAAEIRLPAFAIGGIDESNVDQVVAQGLRRIAVSSAIARSAAVHATVAVLRQRLESR